MYRIDELAARAGTTSRTIRAYQARGLLPPPQLKGRTGYYGDEHLHRLRLIDDLQARGFSLAAIRHTLDTWATGGDLGDLLGFEHLLTAPLTDEQPQRLHLDELRQRFPEAAEDPALLVRAADLGLVEFDADGEMATVPSPLLLEAGSELTRSGIPLAVVLDLVEQLRGDAATIARRFLDLVDQQLLLPLVEGRSDARDPHDVLASLQRLRPIAIEVVRPFVARALQDAIGQSLRAHAQILDARAEDPPGA
ncbi:MerR family transcriptional regulator [Egicoccus sp. AB-alg2]|uniref:MerR family transcriptional regulator n=1 Tax=Egicoccus sp. AB-alg2 TaxID=3242693 RepID=UPI00359E8537